MTALSAAYAPLVAHPLLHATDLDQAREGVGSVFCRHHLDFADTSRALDTRLYGVRLTYMTVTHLAYGAPVTVVPGVLPGWFAMLIPIRGHSRVRYGNEEFQMTPGTAAIWSPVKPLDITWSADCAQVILRIEYKALEDTLSNMLGRSLDRALEFAPATNLDAAPLRAWHAAARTLIDDLDRGVDPRWLVDLEHFLMSRLLWAQPHNYTQDLLTPQSSSGRSAVRRAISLMEGDLQRQWTTDALASEVGETTAWSLQAAFRNDGEAPPMRYLRLARLRHARDCLLRGNSRQGDTVAEIAMRCGFAHLSRFAEQYRERYGERPSETLRRRPSGL